MIMKKAFQLTDNNIDDNNNNNNKTIYYFPRLPIASHPYAMTVINFGSTNVQRRKVALVGYPTSGKTILTKSFVSPLSFRNDNTTISHQYEMVLLRNGP
jgi:hypothetical protein